MRDRYVRDFVNSGVLVDKFIGDMHEALKDVYDFEHIFGRSYKLVDTSTDTRVVYPAAFNGNKEYVSLLPNDNYGSFAFFDIYDSQKNVSKVPSSPKIEINGAVVMWLVLDDDKNKEYLSTEVIKERALKVLSSSHYLTNGSIEITELYEQPENIYKGYSLEHLYSSGFTTNSNIGKLDRQMFMYPYYALRIEFRAVVKALC